MDESEGGDINQAGREESSSSKPASRGFRFNKKGRFTKKEEEEVQRTSHNIFDWFGASSKSSNGQVQGAG